jgi:pimeloyl-ACP methyl ester carboxylesterase
MVRQRVVLVGVLASIAVTSGGCNVIQYQRGRIRSRLSKAGLHETQVRLGDDTISYWDGGSGSPVVLLHGMGLAGLWQWNEQAPALAPTHRVIIPDMLWFGDSSSSRRDYSLGHQVAAVRALIEHLGLTQLDLVGLSYGGIVAYGVAVQDRTRVRSLTLVDSPGPALGRADYDQLTARLGKKDPTEIVVPQTPEAVQKLMALAYEHPPYIPSFAARQLIAEAYTKRREELRAMFNASTEKIEELTANAPRIPQPLCVIWGRNDPLFPLALSDRLLQFADSRSVRHVIEDARHTPNVEYPKEFNKLLQSCLAFGGEASASLAGHGELRADRATAGARDRARDGVADGVGQRH